MVIASTSVDGIVPQLLEFHRLPKIQSAELRALHKVYSSLRHGIVTTA